MTTRRTRPERERGARSDSRKGVAFATAATRWPLQPRQDATPRGGQAIEPLVRVAMERRFGHRFADVRVHDDAAADTDPADLGAAAYAVGRDIVFAPGEYAPESPRGLRLLAHELAHVVQHDRHPGGVSAEQDVSERGDAAEQEAEVAAERVAAGGEVDVRAAPSAALSKGMLDWLEETAGEAWGDVTGGAAAVAELVGEAGATVGDVAGGAWDATTGLASDAWAATEGAGAAAWETAAAVAEDPGSILPMLGPLGAAGGIVDDVAGGAAGIGEGFGSIAEAITGQLGGEAGGGEAGYLDSVGRMGLPLFPPIFGSPSEPGSGILPPMPGWLRTGMEGVEGFGQGVLQGVLPGGSFWMPSFNPDSQAFEYGRAGGQLATGLAEILLGTAGEVGGLALDMTGIGALVGVPVGVLSTGLILQGSATSIGGAMTLANAMSMGGGGGRGGGFDDDDGEWGGGGGRRGGGSGRRGPEKRDLGQVDAVAREFKMSPEKRQEFGEFIEAQKASGNRGSANERGDFTYAELRKLAQEFLGQ